MKQIVLTGSYCSKNKGDAAMRIAASSAIKHIIPDTKITILSSYPEIDKETYNDVSVVRCSRRNPLQALKTVFYAIIWNITHRFLKIDLLKNTSSDELRTYHDADIIVDLSGDGFTEEYGLKCIFAHLVPIIIGLAFSKPVFICAQTLGPFKRTKWFIRSLFNRLPVLSTREYLSLGVLKDCNIIKPKVVIAGDMGFLLDPCTKTRAEQLLSIEGIRIEKPLIGFSVTRLFGHQSEIKNNLLQEDFEYMFASVADSIVDKLDAEVVFISHVTGPDRPRDEREVARSIYEKCNKKSSIHVINGDYSPSETKGIIGQTSLFIGMRMHSNIGALSMRVPTISIASSPKSHGIMSMVGQDNHLIDLSDISYEKLFNMIKDVWNKRVNIRHQLNESIPLVEEMSIRNIFIIGDILNLDLDQSCIGDAKWKIHTAL